MESFKTATLKYENAIRWGYFEAANNFIKEGGTELQIPDFEKLKEIRVTYYELFKSKFSKDGLRAYQTVEIKYYNINHLIENTLIDNQRWKYDKEEKKWYLQSGLPEFK
jgi:hypothetical protein